MTKVFRELRVCKKCGYTFMSRKKITYSCPKCRTYKWDDGCWLNEKDSEDKTSEFKKYLLTKTPEERELIRKLIDDGVEKQPLQAKGNQG